jgi:selenide,water dikinase
LDEPDDAAVWRIDDDHAIVVTTDFFTPVVDDAYQYGLIAAANALSDLYAMGARPIFALNIAAMPPDLPNAIVSEIIRGGAEKVLEAGAVIAGGHTIQDPEPKYGLVAIGLVHPQRMFTKAAVEEGDVLVLTKPLGMGVTTTAIKRGAAAAQDVDQAVLWMQQLNREASILAMKLGIRAATDITGFSLLGHGYEMADASNLAIRFHLPNIPFLTGARTYAELGAFPGGSADNRMFFGEHTAFDPSIDEYSQMMLFDAQTSGGLLVAVPREAVERFVKEAQSAQIGAWPIGEAESGQGLHITADHYRIENITPIQDNLWFHPAV